MFNQSSRILVLVGLIAVAAALRVVPHVPNFSPISALALMGGAYFARPVLQGLWARLAMAILVPLAALFLSDLALGFHSQGPAVYLSFVLVAALGFFALEKRSPLRIGGAAVSGSMVFFVITNLTFWAEGTNYPRTFEGLVECYLMALPFLRNALAGDLFYSAVLFGVWAWTERRLPSRVLAQEVPN